MTPHALTEQLKALCGAHLRSVILHGSAAAGDHTGRRSDYNLLVVLEPLGAPELKPLAGVIRRWMQRGNPAPQFLTPAELAGAAELFPLEVADLQRSHQVLYGQDLVSGVPVRHELLRGQVARELAGKLMQLRQQYVFAAGHPRLVTELLVRSLSTFLVLFRGVLHLYQSDIPAKKMDAARALAKHLQIQMHALEVIESLKRGVRVPGVVPEELFAAYVQVIESVMNAKEDRPHG